MTAINCRSLPTQAGTTTPIKQSQTILLSTIITTIGITIGMIGVTQIALEDTTHPTGELATIVTVSLHHSFGDGARGIHPFT